MEQLKERYNETSESIGNAADNVHTSIDLVNYMINSIRCAGQCYFSAGDYAEFSGVAWR